LELGSLPVPPTRLSRLLQALERGVDWEFIPAHTQAYFAAEGQPSIDPVVMVKLMLLGSLLGTRSDRELVERCADSLACRDFLHRGSQDRVPAHARFTPWRQRLGAEWFRGLRHEIVRQCQAPGLVVSGARTVEATAVKAQASA